MGRTSPTPQPPTRRSLQTLLFGPLELSDLRGRMYLITCLATALVFALTCVQNAQLGLGVEIVLLTGGSSLALLALYALGRPSAGTARQPGIALGILYLNAFVGFFGNGGSQGGVQHFWPAAVGISVFLLQRTRARAGVLLAYALGAVAVLLIEHRYPELVHPYASSDARLADLALSHPLALAATATTVLTVAVSYDQGTRAVREAHARADQLLLALLPQRAARHLQGHGRATEAAGIYAEDVPEATLLFADMVGFSRRAQAAPSEQVVRDLDRLFRALDAIALQHGVEKIKTIGDAYMAAAGLDPAADARPPAQAVASAALAFLEATEGLTFLGEPVQLRIGLATGPVTAGVIGSQRPHYDVWGDTVNLAARLEAHGEPGRIRVCPVTADRLRGTHRCDPGPELVLAERPLTATFWLVAASPAQ